MNNGRKSRFLFTATCFGIAFLYVPMILLIFYSFNKSRIVPVWGGFSTKWYGVLFESEEVWEAIALSLKIATVNASFAMILGTLAGLALVRFGRFKGRTLFSGEFVGWPDQRGFTTITIAHITFSMAYVAVIIQSRLTGMAQDLEEAAQDLGAKPLRVLIDITLPLLAPGMLAGWLLAFTLSLDDLIIASFVTGPGAVTLPILIYSRIRLGLRPDINALATIIILVVAIGVLVAAWVMFRQQKQRELELSMSEEA
jgi:putrescine transport system permease protein